MWRSRSTRSAWCFACSVISAGAAGRAGNGSGRGRTGRGAGRYRRAFRRQPGAGSSRCCGASFRTCRTSSPSSNASSARAMSRQRRDPAYHQGQRFHRWRQRPCRPCQRAGAGPAPRDWLRGMEILAGIRLTNCAPCAMPACSACRRCSATCRRSRRAEPRRGGQSRQGFRRTRGSPASAAACRANNAMGVIRRYS